jgi:long-chain acyl-CoA synthetase
MIETTPNTELDQRSPEYLSAIPLIHHFSTRAERTPRAVAFRFKDRGIWKEVTWAEFADTVEKYAHGLLALGVAEGDRVCMMGRPTPEWLYFDFASQSIGSTFFGVYVTTRASELKYLLDDGEPKVFLAETQEFVDRLLEAEEGQELVRHIVVADTNGMFQYDDSRLLSAEELARRGGERRHSHPNGWRESVAARTPDDISRISYTSGTTGRPKGAMLSSRNLVWSTSALYFSLGNKPGPRDRTVSYMPPASPSEVTYSIVMPALFGTVPHIPEMPDEYTEAFVEINPTLLLAFPRMWETFAARVQVDIDTGRALKRRAYLLALGMARLFYRTAWSGGKPSPLQRASRWIAYQGVFRFLLDKFGLRKLRFVITGGAPVSAEILRLWNCWGVQVQEIYGMTEVAGLATVQMDGRPMPGVAGKPLYGMEIRLDDDGEILLRSPGVFRGYWRKPEATSDTVDSDGWLHTGDIGRLLSDGNLTIVDRRSDLIETADGRIIPASDIEHRLKASPYIKEAMLAGHGREYITSLIEIDSEAVAQWARANRILYTSFRSLIESDPVRDLLTEVHARVNEQLLAEDKPLVMDFRILPKELDPEEGDEVTSTNKVRRRQLTVKFAPLIEEMYGQELNSSGVRVMGRAS